LEETRRKFALMMQEVSTQKSEEEVQKMITKENFEKVSHTATEWEWNDI
jgi:hypothetical protein